MKLMQSDMDLNPSECPTTWISQEKEGEIFEIDFPPSIWMNCAALCTEIWTVKMLRLNPIERFTVTI